MTRKIYVLFALLGVVLFCTSAITASEDFLKTVLSKPILPAWASTSSFDVILREVDYADRMADAKLLECKTYQQLSEYGKELRKSMRIGLGDLPLEKSHLNDRTVSIVKRDKYKVEKVVFESIEGIHVTANLFLPDSPDFRPPYPAVIEPCGHTTEAKGSPVYQRLGVLGAQNGLAVLIYDAINAGERQQGLDRIQDSWMGHNRIGALADLLGQSFGGYRVWDAIRALDYLDTRKDIRHDGYGCFGNSGGGNITAFITALDDRIKAAAPNGYITTFRDAARDAFIGPGDAEQNIFGQLCSGVNHLAFCLMRAPVPILIGSTSGDEVFPFCGTYVTYSNLKDIYTRMGWEDRTAHVWGEGLHGYRESTRVAAVSWMRKWLANEDSAWTYDISRYQSIDKDFDINSPSVDVGLVKGEDWVTKDGDTRTIKGNRTYYDFLRSELKDILSEKTSSDISPETVSQVAGIRRGSATGYIMYDSFEIVKAGEFFLERGTFKFRNGLVLPSVLVTGKEIIGMPMIIVARDSFSNHSEEVREAVEAGRPVLLLCLIGCGEISENRRVHYGMPQPEEEMSVLLRSLGRTCVSEQAEELIIAAELLKTRFGSPIEILAHELTCISAAHAHAVCPELIEKVTHIDPPASWTTSIQESLRVPYASTIPGALKYYDWIEL